MNKVCNPFCVIGCRCNSSVHCCSAAGSEPFDEGFDRHIWALSDQSLNLDGEIAKFRREEPNRLMKVMQEILDKQRAVDEKEAELLAPDDIVAEEPEEGACFLGDTCNLCFNCVCSLRQHCSVRER